MLNTKKLFTKILTHLNTLVLYKTYSCAYNISSGGYTTISANDFNKTAPSGYIAIAVKRFTAGNNQVAVVAVYPENAGSSTVMTLRNLNANTAMSGTATIGIMYIRATSASEINN